jgi:hypothetical protein
MPKSNQALDFGVRWQNYPCPSFARRERFCKAPTRVIFYCQICETPNAYHIYKTCIWISAGAYLTTQKTKTYLCNYCSICLKKSRKAKP